MTSFEVEAIDVEARDAVELERFRAQLAAPEDDPQSPFRWVPAFIGVMLGILLVGLCGTIAQMFGWNVPGPVQISIFMLGLLAPLGYLVWRRALAPFLAGRGRVRARFTIRFHRAELAIAGGTTPMVCDLADIERFESRKTKLVIVRRNGSESMLPLAMPTPQENEALASRLEEALHEARTAGGYRGIRIGEDAGEEEEDHLRQGKA